MRVFYHRQAEDAARWAFENNGGRCIVGTEARTFERDSKLSVKIVRRTPNYAISPTDALNMAAGHGYRRVSSEQEPSGSAKWWMRPLDGKGNWYKNIKDAETGAEVWVPCSRPPADFRGWERVQSKSRLMKYLSDGTAEEVK